ncbi:MAG: methionyl-tRNA formyltransferase [Ruminococcaceae bacterium]|nr:methionyl-tRNA formyltransferase [Oscillospiraceae bacterium]
MKLIFMGTPDLAKTVLKALTASDNEVLCVVTQPDKPKGRGYELTPPPVKVFALENNIPVYQPETLKNGELQPVIDEYKPDAIIVAAYGKLLPPYIIEFGGYGCINVHGSILPKYRGAAPIQRAIMDGEKVTGITIMRMDNGLDTGDILTVEETEITENDNFETMHDRLAELGGSLLVRTLKMLEEGSVIPQKQDDSLSNYAKKIEKSDCLLDFNDDACSLCCKIRGLSPIPLSFAYLNGKMVKFIDAEYSDKTYDIEPGTVVSLDGGNIRIACKNGSILLKRLLPEGKGRMNSSDFINGRRVSLGDVFKSTKE